MSLLTKKYKTDIVPSLQKEMNLDNIMKVPRLEKVILNVGIGSAVSDAKSLETAAEELTAISGQRPVKTYARKSIAGFKLREGVAIGVMVSLRGFQMLAFLDRLIHTALPRVRDFRGLNPKAFDGRGNYNFSIKEQIIFSEIDVDSVDSYHGMNISIVSTSEDDEEAYTLLKRIGMPFRERKAKTSSKSS